MSLQFRSVLRPPPSLVEQLAACDPANPLQTPEYAKAHQSLGERVCLLGLYAGNDLVAGCLGFLSGWFVRRNLHICSLPTLPEPEAFWRGVVQSCRRLGAWSLQIDTYASPGAVIPQLPGELERRDRWEYALDLGCDNIPGRGEHTASAKHQSCRQSWTVDLPDARGIRLSQSIWNSWMLPPNGAPIAVRKWIPARTARGPWRCSPAERARSFRPSSGSRSCRRFWCSDPARAHIINRRELCPKG